MFKPTLIPMHHYDIEYAGQPWQEGVAGCKARQAYSPENIRQRQNRNCCLQGNLRENTINQARSAGWNGREESIRIYQETKDICCKLVPDHSAIRKTIRCNYTNK